MSARPDGGALASRSADTITPPYTQPDSAVDRALQRAPAAYALLCFIFLAAIVAGPAIAGRSALGPDSWLDWDPLYRTAPAMPLPPFNDYTPIVLHYPRDAAFARGLHEGRLDQWNPLVSAGAPLWAEQGGPFFPLKLPFYVWPSVATYQLFLALRLVFAAIGAYALARRRGLAPLAAITAGAAFEVSGVLIAHLPFGANSPIYVLPWLILGSIAIAEERTPRAAAGAALALGLAGLGGHPTMILMVCSAFVVCSAALIAARWRTPRAMISIAGLTMLAALLGAALAAPSLLPLAELASVGSSYKSRPAGEFVWTFELARSRHLLPIALFAPNFFTAFRDALLSMLDFAPAIGLLGLTTAVAGMIGGLTGGRIDIALTAVALYGIGLSLAPPGFGWLHDVPGLRLVLPNYAWPLVVLPATQAIGAGVELCRDRRGWRLVLIAAIVVALAAGSLALVTDVHPVLMPFGAIYQTALATAGSWGLLRPALFTAAVVVAGLLAVRTGAATWCAPAVAAVLVGQQLFVMLPFTRFPVANSLAAGPSPAVAFLHERMATDGGRILGAPYRVGHPSSSMLFGLPDIRSAVPLPVRRAYEYLHAISPRAGTSTIQDLPVITSPLLDLASVRFVIQAAPTAARPGTADRALLTPPAPAADDPRLSEVYRDERVVVYENRAAVPRARIVRQVIPAADEAAAAESIRANGKRGGSAAELALTERVVVEPGNGGEAVPQLTGEVTSNERVDIIEQSDPDRLVLQAQLERPGLVVIADTYYPGWSAWVDGAETALFPADLLFRAVAVPAGAHTIEMRYQPQPFRYGVGAFLLSAAICALLLWRRRAMVAAGSR